MFVSENKKFFESHDFGNMPTKFIHRVGELHERTHIKGFVKVLEKWKKIHKNAQQYIYNILSEVPYSDDIIDVISFKLQNKIQIRSIFSDYRTPATPTADIVSRAFWCDSLHCWQVPCS